MDFVPSKFRHHLSQEYGVISFEILENRYGGNCSNRRVLVPKMDIWLCASKDLLKLSGRNDGVPTVEDTIGIILLLEVSESGVVGPEC